MAGSPQPARDAPLRGAIFDVDGVLVDSPHEQAWRETLDRLMQGPWREAAAGTSWQPGALTSEVYAAQVAGKPREDGARAVLESIGLQDPDGARLAEYAAAKQERVQELIDQHVFRPYEDALRFLERLRAAGVRLAAASSSQNAPALLSRIRLDGAGTVRDALDADLSGRRFQHGKPHPAIFLAAAEALGLAPAEVVVVEDAPSGIAAATAGGMRSIGVDRLGNGAELERAGATWVVQSLDELPPIPLAA